MSANRHVELNAQYHGEQQTKDGRWSKCETANFNETIAAHSANNHKKINNMSRSERTECTSVSLAHICAHTHTNGRANATTLCLLIPRVHWRMRLIQSMRAAPIATQMLLLCISREHRESIQKVENHDRAFSNIQC